MQDLELQRQAERWSEMLKESDRLLDRYNEMSDKHRQKESLYNEILGHERMITAFEEDFRIDGDKIEKFCQFLERSQE